MGIGGPTGNEGWYRRNVKKGQDWRPMREITCLGRKKPRSRRKNRQGLCRRLQQQCQSEQFEEGSTSNCRMGVRRRRREVQHFGSETEEKEDCTQATQIGRKSDPRGCCAFEVRERIAALLPLLLQLPSGTDCEVPSVAMIGAFPRVFGQTLCETTLMSEFFRQFTDDQLALMLCGFAILGCWCLLQISYYVGRATNGAANQTATVLERRRAASRDKAA